MSKKKYAVLLGAAIVVAIALIVAIVLLALDPFGGTEEKLTSFTLNNAVGQPDQNIPSVGPEDDPDASAESVAYQLYKSALGSMPNAMEYAMFDFIPDGIPELIVKRGSSEDDCWFDCYSVTDGKLVHMNADGIVAASCQFYGKGDQLFTVYQDAALFVIEVGDDLVMKQKMSDETIESLMATYTDTIVYCPADDTGLLDVLLMGGTYEGLNGWIRYKGVTYFYLDGELMKNFWVGDDSGNYYYLGSNGTVTMSIGTQEVNQLLSEYYNSYINCINAQDISYLMHSSEKNTEIMKKRIASDENRSKFYEFTGGGVYVAKADNDSGHLFINGEMKLNTYSRQTGEALGSTVLYYTFEIAFDSGEWLVDRVGYPSASDYKSGRIA